MRKIVLLFVMTIFAINLFANPIDKKKALLIASNFYSNNLKLSSDLTLVYECISQKHSTDKNKQAENLTFYYVFNSDNGFIIISGDDDVYPVLGYSKSKTFDVNNLPDNFRKWLENYKKQINYVISNNIKATEEIKKEWEDLKQNKKISKSTSSVNPLVTVTWGQSPYVNALCPYDIDAGAGNGYHAVAGCPATAMAQIMKYWNYPTTGTGFHSYNHDTYGNLSANFGSTTYEWESMPNNVYSPNNAVATLMYHCGVAVEMEYGPTSSGSYVIMDFWAWYSDEQTCEYAYQTYFGYDPEILEGLEREDYSDNEWKELLKNDLDAGRPIQYAGYGQGGHTFVCDGYDNYDFFHINWGWSGSNDGYFLLDALNPGSGGTGSGAGTYNDDQQAIIGIQPPENNMTYDIELLDNLTVTPNPIEYEEGFIVHTDIKNVGINTFNGDYCAAIFDDDSNFIDYVEIKTEYSLQSNYHYTNGLSFMTSGISTAFPGTYYIRMFYRPTDGNWIIMNDGSYNNYIQLDIQNSNDIALYSDIVVSTGDIIIDESFDVNVDIANFSNTNFNGSYSVGLYNINDDNFETIETKNDMTLTAQSHYENGLTFSSTGINVEPGTYLLAVLHKEDGEDWELTGSQSYINPIKVIVKIESFQADIYENNNTAEEAYILPVYFSMNNATISTIGSNNHIGSDLDYYKIQLESGYYYTINARAHDSYNSDNGQTYTNDVSWSYLYNSVWSDVYDDIMPNNFTVNNGGTIIFNVSPYFIGGKGTYLLDISISRTAIINVETFDDNNFISIYPNPANDFVKIKTSKPIQKVEIIDISGKLISTNLAIKNNLKISTSNLENGIYYFIITGENYIEQRKIIISK